MIILSTSESLGKSFGSLFKFHSDLLFKYNKTKIFLSFYREIILHWKKHLAMMIKIPCCIFSQYMWYNANIQVDKTSIKFSWFSEEKQLIILHNFLVKMAP